MKIAIFTDSFLPGVGGTEKAVLGLANELQKQHEVVVCCPQYNKKFKDEFSFKVLRTKSLKLTKNDYFAFPTISTNFKKRLEEFAPDVIHCQSVSPMMSYAIKFAKKSNTPIISTVHTKFRTAFQRSIKSRLIVNFLIKDIVKKLNQMSAVFTVSNDMIGELKSYGYDGKVEVIRNGAMFERIADVDSLKPLALEKYQIISDKILLYVGHIVKFKNLQFTFDALKIVKTKIPNFKMILVGAGFDDEYFRKYVSDNQLSDNVLFTGQITNEELLSSLYSIGELFVFPSIFDNDPLTIVEAALHRVPAITLQGTGSSERIENNVSGFIVENNVQVFANKIVELLQHKEVLKIVGIEAERRIPKTWETTAKEYIEIYNNNIKRGE